MVGNLPCRVVIILKIIVEMLCSNNCLNNIYIFQNRLNVFQDYKPQCGVDTTPQQHWLESFPFLIELLAFHHNLLSQFNSSS